MFSQQPSTYLLDDVYKDCVLLEKNVKNNPALYINSPRSGQLQFILDESNHLFKAIKIKNTELVKYQLEMMLKTNRQVFKAFEKKKTLSKVRLYYFSSS